MKVTKNMKLQITDANGEHPFNVGEIVTVVDVLPETVLYVRNKNKVDGYIIKGEYVPCN